MCNAMGENAELKCGTLHFNKLNKLKHKYGLG